jgi:hypothetical protein
MRFSYPPPANEADFERLCLRLLQEEWSSPQLQLYGHRGEEQQGVDIFDPNGTPPLRAAQCKLHLNDKSIPPAEIRKEVDKAKTFSPLLHHYCILTTAKRSTRAQREILAINQHHREVGLFQIELFFWDDLEALLNKHPKVREEFYYSVPGQIAATIKTQIDNLGSKLDRLGDKIDSSGLSPSPTMPGGDVQHPGVFTLSTSKSLASVEADKLGSDTDAALAQLAELIEKKRLVVILGDVLDESVALSRDALAETVSRRAELETPDLYYAGSLIEKRHGRDELAELTLRELQNVNGSSTLPYQNLAGLPISTIVSLHPDIVLEMVLARQVDGYRSIVTDDDLVVLDLEPGRKELFLLGGSARFGIGLLLTQQDYDGLIARTNHLARGLRDRLALRAILLLGCNLADQKLKKLFYWITRHRTRKDGLLFISGSVKPDDFWASWNPIFLNESPADLLLKLSVRNSPSALRDVKQPIPVLASG